MSEADILASTYDDLCTVYRPTKDVLPSGETVFRTSLEGRIVHKDIPCALAKHSGGKIQRSPSTAVTPTEYSVFTRPEIDIQAGDTLEIVQLGKTVIAIAGRAERHRSHNNVPVELRGDTV